ncbi:MAG: hypothetical protein J5845_08850 [Lachnospiraceae bacterium]|nr:hypothetical protein [Lachnospiraceae bacterium]
MKPLEEYADLFERLGLTELYVEENGAKLRLKKESTHSPHPIITPLHPAWAGSEYPSAGPAEHAQGKSTAAAEETPQAAASEDSSTAKERKADTFSGDTVKAPLLGIFHISAGGKVRSAGEQVKKGEPVCTIEAMKMMNEVVSPRDGMIREILVKDGTLVEFGQDLIVLG